MDKYVKVADVIALINGLDSLPFEEETEDMVNSLPTCDMETVRDLLEGKWVDTDKVQKALGMSFTECFSIFDFSREASWWSIVGKTEEERAREGQCVVTRFRVKGGGGENGTERDT